MGIFINTYHLLKLNRNLKRLRTSTEIVAVTKILPPKENPRARWL